jgi:hypothetical protein
MLCIIASSFHDFAVWAARPGWRGKSLLTYGAASITAEMIVFSIFFPYYFDPVRILIFLPVGFLIGLAVFGVRIAVQKPEATRQW